MTREVGRLNPFWRNVLVLGDLIVISMIQSRVGRLTYAALEGAVARG